MPRCPVHGDDWNKMNSWILPATRITHKMPRRTTTSRPNIAGVVWEALAGNPTSDSANVGAVEGWEQAPWPRRFYVNWFECQLDMENEERIKRKRVIIKMSSKRKCRFPTHSRSGKSICHEKIRHNKRNCIPRTSKALTVELNKAVPGQEWFVFTGLCAFSSMLFTEWWPKDKCLRVALPKWLSDEMYRVWSGYNVHRSQCLFAPQ